MALVGVENEQFTMTRKQKVIWLGLAGITAFIFIGTIHPPKLPAFLTRL